MKEINRRYVVKITLACGKEVELPYDTLEEAQTILTYIALSFKDKHYKDIREKFHLGDNVVAYTTRVYVHSTVEYVASEMVGEIEDNG
jgi:hypothetical protein